MLKKRSKKNKDKTKCMQCNAVYPNKDILELVWEKKKFSLLICRTCAKVFYKKEVKEADISQQILNRIGLGKEGYKPYDVKSDLDNWANSLTKR